MRANDAALPAVTPDTHPQPWSPRARLVIALERVPYDSYTWDDADPNVNWDDPNPDAYVWDNPQSGGGYTDVWCDMQGLEIHHGEPDDSELMATSTATLQLLDPDGRYRTRDLAGRLVYYSLGKRLSVWCRLTDPTTQATTDWWLFNGRIATWREDLTGQVTIEAVAQAAELAQDAGRSWSAGAANQTSDQRMASIMSTFAYTGRYRFDQGTNLLLAYTSSETALDGMQRAAWSDGGVLFTDVDDTLVFRNRNWRTGRSDQTVVPTVSDNVCDADVVAWEVEGGDDDSRFASKVVLANTATPQLTATATTNATTLAANTVYTHPGDDLWTQQGAGDVLAQWILDARYDPRMAVDLARLYMHDARFDYWSQGIDRRIGDKIRFWHDDLFTTKPQYLDLTVILQTVRHFITPSEWVVEWETTPSTGFDRVELWDRTGLLWDDTDPLAVWR